MLQSYLPIYQLALDLQALRGRAELLRGSTYHRPGLSESDAQSYVVLLKALQKCSAYNFYHTAEMAKRIAGRTLCADYNDLYSDLTHLNDTLSHELEKEAVFRIAPEQKSGMIFLGRKWPQRPSLTRVKLFTSACGSTIGGSNDFGRLRAPFFAPLTPRR